MSKLTKRLAYGVSDTGKWLKKEALDSFYFLLFWTTPPFTPKIFYTGPIEDFFSYRTFYNKTTALYKKGYIKRLGTGKFLCLKQFRYKYLDSDLDKRTLKCDQKWDKKWHLIIYDIPENKAVERNALRKYLENLGFGKAQNSCWVSCYNFSEDIYKFCLEHKIADYICIYQGNFFAGKNIDNLIEDIWHLSKLNEQYQAIIDRAQEYIRDLETKQVNGNDFYEKYFRLFHDLKNLLLADPFLPKEFVTIHALRENAETKTRQVLKLILSECKPKINC
jgi:phenylacetic acid degradation operon negative regulatory protein